MAGFSDYLENKILNEVFGGSAFTAPATVWLAAFTTAPTSDAGGGAVEVSGGGYARIELTNNTTNFPTTTTSEKNLGVAKSFPEATGSWGTVKGIGIYDAVSGTTNLLAWCTIADQVININDVLRIPAGVAGLRITLD